MRLYITRGALTIATKDSILCKTIGICNFNENDANDNLKKLVIGSKTLLCPLMSVGWSVQLYDRTVWKGREVAIFCFNRTTCSLQNVKLSYCWIFHSLYVKIWHQPWLTVFIINILDCQHWCKRKNVYLHLW